MSLKLRKNKALSVIMTLAMVFSMFAGMTFTSFADTETVTEIDSLSDITSMSGNYKLTDDVTVDASTWTSIGTSSAPFTGTFDGDGHTVTWSGTTAGTGGYVGIFGVSSGTVKNLTASGSLTVTGSNLDYISTVVAYNEGTIEGITNNADISATGSYNVGGIAGFNDEGTISNCQNNGDVTSTSKTGGIVGENAGTVSSCANTGAITNPGSGKNGAGGIAGRNGNNNTAVETGVIINCYNTGAISGSNGRWDGGITGFQNSLSSVTNCYNIGSISGYSNKNAIVGNNEGTTTYAYALDTSQTGNSGSTADEIGITKTETEMKSADFVALLNENDGTTDNAWRADNATSPENNGYPVLTGINGTGTGGSTDPETPVIGDVSITTGGTYTVTGDAVLTVSTSDAVTIKGNGTDDYSVTINCTAAANLTIEDLQITAPASTSANIINFTTGSNTLNISGSNLLENDRSASGALNNAAIRVPSGVTLNITGDGTLYLYKNSMGAGIGSNTSEASGTINFNHTGNIFVKGSMTGALVGGDTGVGDITINDGILNMFVNARGAGIGGSNQCNGGDVTLNGGNVKITCDFAGHAIGSGASGTNGGTLTINGGSLYVEKTSNSSLNEDTIINAAITPNNAACLTLTIDDTFSGGDFTVAVGSDTVYDGRVNLWQADRTATTTQGTWKEEAPSEIYLWIPTNSGQSVTLTVESDDNWAEYTTSYSNGEWSTPQIVGTYSLSA